MTAAILEVFEHALIITGFVLVMMLVIEYLNVRTQGRTMLALGRNPVAKNLLGAALGATPGCLGAFAAGSLYTHKIITFGAITATMIATCGDESFVMLALFPGKALLLFGVLFATGFLTGIAVDLVSGGRHTATDQHPLSFQALHANNEDCGALSLARLAAQWRACSPRRAVPALALLLFTLAVAAGRIGHEESAWIRLTLGLAGLAGLFLVTTVSEHFLEEHLWRHVIRVHGWRIFLWTFGALLVVQVGLEHLDLGAHISRNPLQVLFLACLVGIIPESGPHLVFVTLFAEGAVPFSILLAGSIVQDGHGMLPILAHSRRAFCAIKGINFAVGLAVGLLGYAMGW